MTTLEKSFVSYDDMLAKAIAQFNKDLQAFSDALDTVLMNRAPDDGAIVTDTREVTE